MQIKPLYFIIAWFCIQRLVLVDSQMATLDCDQPVEYTNLPTQSCWLTDRTNGTLVRIPNCLEINASWVSGPPSIWPQGQYRPITVRLQISSTFYTWAQQSGVFATVDGIHSPTTVQSICNLQACTSWWSFEPLCCLWHATVHTDTWSTPASQSNVNCRFANSPSTDTSVYSGNVKSMNWTMNGPRFSSTGPFAIFVRIVIDRLQLILISKVDVQWQPQASTLTQAGSAVCSDYGSVECSGTLSRTGTIILVVFFAIFIISIVLLMLMLPRRKPHERRKQSYTPVKWMIDTNDVVENKTDPNLSRVTLSNRPRQCKIVRVKNIIVSVKTIWCEEFRLNAVQLEELRKLIHLNHNNVTKFIGLSFANEELCIYTEYCYKECLNSLLKRDCIPLGWSFRLSFLTDIVKGMMYLHGHDIVHGRLNSKNCVVDDRWVCKVTERPDMLHVPVMDVYSFGTIMCEVARKKDAASLIELCWSDLLNRPQFTIVKERLVHMNPRKLCPFDMVMVMMQEYSAQLENIVEERTEALRTEKLLTDQLLHSMLPKPVVEQLRLGKQIPPEAFEQCTIYFSDIVGFTTISSNSTPFEVVELLNKLYTEFDEIIDRYDVYKVETIGDAYMVASGVPRRNGERHAMAITDMSLDLITVSHSFVIPHMPQEPLKIRVGLHSGPVCAGVVGLKMPRYCLFGDTVNTASRMESTGEPYKIHCSDPTHDILDRFGGFEFEKRGTVTVKGKGEMQTWWVVRRTREEVDHDVCPLPKNFLRRMKKAGLKNSTTDSLDVSAGTQSMASENGGPSGDDKSS